MNQHSRSPLNNYTDALLQVDEQLCDLFKKRLDLSGKLIATPSAHLVSTWAVNYGLEEHFLKIFFGTLRNYRELKPPITPNAFRKHIPVLKSLEKEGCIYTVLSIRQHENSSVISLEMDGEIDHIPMEHQQFRLDVGEDYTCRPTGGGGSERHYTYNFVVSPPLPDHPTGLDLVFMEYRKNQPTGFEVVIKVD